MHLEQRRDAAAARHRWLRRSARGEKRWSAGGIPPHTTLRAAEDGAVSVKGGARSSSPGAAKATSTANKTTSGRAAITVHSPGQTRIGLGDTHPRRRARGGDPPLRSDTGLTLREALSDARNLALASARQDEIEYSRDTLQTTGAQGIVSAQCNHPLCRPARSATPRPRSSSASARSKGHPRCAHRPELGRGRKPARLRGDQDRKGPEWRDHIEAYREDLTNLADAGIEVIC